MNDPAPIIPARGMFDAVLQAMPANRAVRPSDLRIGYSISEVRAVLRTLAREGQIEIISTNLGRKYRRRSDESWQKEKNQRDAR